MQPAYFNLEQLIWAPPLPAICAILLLSGLIRLGRTAVRIIFPSADPISRLSAPFYGAMIAGTAVQALACAGWATLAVVRVFAVVLALAGAADLIWTFATRGKLISPIRKLRPSSYAWTIVAGLSVIALLLGLLLSIAPVTDADSLNYHLGTAVLMLRTGTIGMLPDWFSSQFSGLGEMVNAIGVALGSDSFGSLLQFCGLAVIVLIIANTANAPLSGPLAASAVIAMPVCVSLVSSAKPQLFPAAGLAVAAAVLSRLREFELRPALLILGLLIFALASKYSFAIPVFVLGCWLTFRCRSLAHFSVLAAASALAAAAVLGPLLMFRWSHFGDPLSPMLSAYIGVPIPGARFWSSVVRSSDNGLPRGLNIFVPSAPRGITGVLLYSPFILVAAAAQGRKLKGLVLAAIGCFVLDLAFTQQAARFFLDPMLWLAVAVAQQTPESAWSPKWAAAIIPQLALTAGLAGFGVWNLTPGAFSESLRNRTLANSSLHYTAMKWLDEALPQNAVVLLMFTNQIALSPRATMSMDGIAADFDNPDSAFAYYRALAISRGVTHTAIFRDAAYDPQAPAGALTRCLDRLVDGPEQFTRATRNPYNRHPYTVEVWTMNFHKC